MTKQPSPVVIDLKFARASLAAALLDAFPGRDVMDMANPVNAERDLSAAGYALVWKPDPGLFRKATNLKVIFSGGAGVDHILSAYELPDVPIVRFVDRSLTDRMSEWVVMNCLMHLRHMPYYARSQKAHVWRPVDPQPEARDVTVGIMGLGVLGLDAVNKLKAMGFNVIGWSRRKKEVEGITTFDAADMRSFLGQSDILVGLLPLTPDTRGLYNSEFFSGLKQGGALGRPVFLNAGRGGSQVEEDLVAAIREGILGGASLDVFASEPLASDSPLWDLANVIMTPHAAADSDVRALIRYVERQISRYEHDGVLENTVDRHAGY